jgi:hypothetical protein
MGFGRLRLAAAVLRPADGITLSQVARAHVIETGDPALKRRDALLEISA